MMTVNVPVIVAEQRNFHCSGDEAEVVVVGLRASIFWKIAAVHGA